jgi:ABC-type sugar transport system ATPase subunit
MHGVSFLTDLHEVFPGVDIAVTFAEKTDETIQVRIKTDQEWLPLEITGTGVLQAIQILSYIHRFEPSIVVLDEPDSHLHPNNQRLLCALLRRVAEDRGTQIMLTTHSRHVVDAIGRSSGFLWVRKGFVDVAGPDDEIGILLDIGALDVKERVGQPGTKAIVLTEDEITRPLETIFESSGFNMEKTTILPYFGISTIKQLRPLTKVIQGSNPSAKIIVHRDRDFYTDEEVSSWEADVRALGANPYVTPRRDIEGCFVNPDYLSETNKEFTEMEFQQLLNEVLEEQREKQIEDYVNGRIDTLKKRTQHSGINAGALAVEGGKGCANQSETILWEDSFASNAAPISGRSRKKHGCLPGVLEDKR